ncbi:TPA: hypothetical protein DCP77_02425 [Candidatus Collierbacteria bacterium]|uniref:Intein-containing protein n=1 Tax=Candidatus Collierbacteria bacterium GW2011_GWA2_42_17 TaxID=1618378 RepID=A0A0G0Z3U8_9BACT|nr:MAG: intein-containing protein [Candidatus Collierbacteria bacterium GW2011_GWB2_42_12]KKS43424.1 MAG: intein-containing protein [Candidatus Collierbacteria bacterium GW2011_GWA2_42_17]KKS61594.1 MAG: intein-containing protein [Candidatus Collierbacteria bacterium GW2011_GWE2_42_48]KKS61857.1 MAG: intein-containing protein [Candidatus Collierbacteria bacterium GW2011_GWD2_42_50]KKS61924.1 MAG: intein-containing protein [Candidatus Collierbacteria bacterium GW2011_GWF1_42_50]KKS64657.1 MAG: 
MAYVLGFIYADGAVEDCRKSSRTCYLCLSNNDLDILRDILWVMSTKQTIVIRGPRVMKIDDREYWCKTNYYVRIGNKVIYDDLTKLGLCPRKSLVIELPEIPNEFFSYFLRGYFDSDGCIHIENIRRRLKIIFTSGSRSFLEKLGTYIGRLVSERHVPIYTNRRSFQLSYGGNCAKNVAALIYQDIVSAPYLKYKYEKYTNYLSTKKVTV